MDPVVSIIIPCYNDADFIEKSVQSALNQTYPYKEIIIVDDGSNEETKKVLKKLQPKITALITQENKGQASARNSGIKEAKGEYILTLDSDDYFEADFCEKAIPLIDKNHKIKIVSCYAKRFQSGRKKNIYKPKGGNLADFIKFNAALGTSLFRRCDAVQIGGYDENMKSGFEDWEFFIRLLKKGGNAYVIPENLYNYRIKKNSTTSIANTKKYELLKYIYLKHKDLYILYFDSFVDYLLNRIEIEEREKLKNLERIDFLLGRFLLKPFRFIKKIFR